MKNGWRRVFVCAAGLLMALTGSALAADNQTDDWTTANDEKCTVTCTVENNQAKSYTAGYSGNDLKSGNQYVLLVVKPTEGDVIIKDSTIMYIDQSGVENNAVLFSNFIPLATPDCQVILGGEFEGSTEAKPKTLGTIIGKGPQGVGVSGPIALVTSKILPTITISGTTSSGENFSQEATIGNISGNNATYTFSAVPPGSNYSVVMTCDKCITVTQNGVSVQDASSKMPQLKMGICVGDIVADDKINMDDLTVLLNDFYKTGERVTDLDRNGKVEMDDLTLLLGNFNKTSAKLTFNVGN